VLEHIWSGWSLKRSALMKIIREVKENLKGLDFVDFPLVPEGALAQVNKVDFFRVTSHLSILPEGVQKIKDLLLSTGSAAETVAASDPQQVTAPIKKRNFLFRFFQKLSQKLGSKAVAQDGLLFKNLLKIIGNGNEKNGRAAYMKQCADYYQERNYGESGAIPTSAWLNGTNYECLTPWMEKLIKLSRDFPANDLRRQNKWLTEVLYILDEQIPQAMLLNYLGPDKFIYYLEVTGFRSGDEDGDDGVYVSNVYGEPAKKHPYANGLISVLADKSKISVTELDQTTGGY